MARAYKINYRHNDDGTVSAVVANGPTLESCMYSGAFGMGEDDFKFFRETLTIGAMALDGVIDLEINDITNQPTEESQQ